MKEFIYLDTSFLNSFVAQANDGLPINTTSETLDETSESHNKKQGNLGKHFLDLVMKTGSFSIPAILQTPEGELRFHFEPGKYSEESSLLSQTDAGKEIISKQLHDNTFNQFLNYLEKNNLLTKTNQISDKCGYVEIESNFELVDFRIFEAAFSEDMVDAMSGERLIDPGNKASRQEINKYVKQLGNEFSYYRKTLSLLLRFLPSSTFIKLSNSVAPLKEEYIRGTANELIFKYGQGLTSERIKVLGKVTRQLKLSNHQSETKSKSLAKIIDEFKNFVDSMLINDLNVVKDGNYIINPIAIYFD